MLQTLDNNPFEIALQEATSQLKSCQEQKGYLSCFECEKVITCQIRLKYVKAVHESMNEGKGGGFDF